MSKLKRQLPKMPPTARSGELNRIIALVPVASSGKDVTPAKRIVPTQVRPIPVFSANISALWESDEPMKITKVIHIITWRNSMIIERM
jgi:hypothetical protein